MSSSASPSAVPSAKYAEHLSNLIAIPSLSHEEHYFLGPIGNLDPTDFIIGKTNRIPFRLANPNLGHWRNTFKFWPSLEKTTPEKSWTTWYKRVSASKQTHWDEIGIGQALALTIANSAKDEPLMAAATYFWSNTINTFLFNQGPMTPTLIDITMITGLDVSSLANPMNLNTKNQYDFRTKSICGLIREPADAGKKRRTRSSAVDTLAPAPKKKAKLKKPKPTDDLPALDPSIEQALDEEEIGEDIDQAADEILRLQKKKIAMKKKSAAPIPKPAPPPPPPSSPIQQPSSDHTPSAAGSYHVEEEVQPAAPTIPALAHLFSFDIKDYLDEETEEDTTSKSLAPLSDNVKKTLEDISHRLEASSLDSLVVNCGPIRTRLHEVQALIPDELADVLTPAVYLEQHQEKAKLRLAERRERKDIEATIQANRQLVHEEKSKLDQLSEGPIKSNIDRLEAHKIELLAQLEECNTELDMEHKKLADLPKSVEEQKARLKSAIKNVADLTKSLKVIPRTDTQDAQAIEEVEQMRQRAISAIQQYLSR
uniref:DUF1409 domain-containing protein n=1 Tax=Oryza sativa subsp. japonica TaxID=39947 RepID=Q2QV47_ORYSJ|nr:hypothetical protein LOC_Os12g14050 [Oryza sativa Japonica Group]